MTSTRFLPALAPGEHPVRFDGAAAAPGVYLLRLTQSGKVAVGKVAVLK